MIFPKEFEKCAMMSEKCPNCGQLVNASFSRLVKDSCGHTKCRMCLVYEAHGCKICQAERNTQDYLVPCSMNGEPNDANKSTREEIVLPLELVINKDSKSKENHSDSIGTECRSLNPHHDNVTTFDNNTDAYKPTTNDTVTNDDSGKVYIPKIETHDVVLNIHAHLRNESNSEIRNKNDDKTASLQNPHDNQVQEEKSEEAVKKNKNVRCRDRSHIMILPGNPERYKCNVCGKIFRNKKGKCYHDACVTGIKPYQCTFCDKTFVKRSHFEYHERVHKGYKPYKCNLCEKAFPQQNKLNRHMFSHSKEKQFLCPECNKRYSKRDDLKNHLSIHNATTTYNCKSCDKSFRILSNLKRHMRTHTSERPHTCDQCSKSFKDKSLLIRHKRIHGKERPFSCANCNRVFLSKSELRRHLTVHLDEKPFSCGYCQTLFRRKDNLNRHIRHHHSEDSNCERQRKTAVEADRNCSTKSNQQRQRQKPKRTQPKSPGKVATMFANSRDQINSRLDSMGNITPVIRTTSEVSNAVPVINGPINIRRLEDKTDRKIFTYTEPIPIAEAAVLNCRIEEKLYPQSASSHNHFVRSYLMDRNSKVNSYPNNKLASQENHSSTATSQSEPRTEERKDPVADTYEKKTVRTRKEKDKQNEEGKKDESSEKERSSSELKEDLSATSLQRSNYVSTIKKHTTQQSERHLIENSTNNGDSKTTNQSTMPKDFQDSCQKKQSGVHWRRRITETLKPC
ncbi:uncharacterized protein [Linepithema humile]|uniref:uncharacterized protein n=1 Tax=Linepithema humile TaxID=83485 RepID=UPI0006237C9B|nr:PREDICTED: putative zinc finger protein 724 [Linepithema humile]